MASIPSAVDQCDRCAPTLVPDATESPERLAEATGWHEFHTLVDQLTPEEALEPGYFPEGWTVRDLIGHIGAWLAEAAQLFEQMRAGTYSEGELDVDAANARFFELMRGLPLETVHLQAWSARWRMISVWGQLPEPTEASRRWLAKAGGEHYAEHLPRLRVWTGELVARRRPH